jgi:hypothetical protein
LTKFGHCLLTKFDGVLFHIHKNHVKCRQGYDITPQLHLNAIFAGRELLDAFGRDGHLILNVGDICFPTADIEQVIKLGYFSVGDILPTNGDIYKIIELGKRIVWLRENAVDDAVKAKRPLHGLVNRGPENL